MNTKNKIIAALTIIALLIPTLILSFADEPAPMTTSKIVMESEISEDSVYGAYKVLDVVVDGSTYKYSVPDKYRAVLQELTGADTDNGIITYISKLNATQTRTFADSLYEKVKGMGVDMTSSDNTFDNVPKGYYLIVETETGSNPDDVYSLVMLSTMDVEGTLNIKTKEETVTLKKELKETNDSTGEVTDWQDAADYDIGDIIPFRLVSTLPKNIKSYDTYEYIYHDTMSEGLTFNDDAVISIVKPDGTKIDITSSADKTVAAGDTFTFSFADLLALGAEPNDTVEVLYTATLNEKCLRGSAGNPNVAYLEFSNNPYDKGHGTTIPDKVKVFTYLSIVDKVDGEKNPLEGAGFTLYKLDAEVNEYVQYSEEIKGENLTIFEFDGLDAGMYKLVETTVPENYNKADDITFTIEAEYETESADPMFIELRVPNNDNFTIHQEEGLVDGVEIIVENLTGLKLPETGGIGTTIFYIVGGIIVLVAGALLITKKRIEKN